jgi:SpoVK/Ycf46/Vps4 family AAA+-type ATPase
MPSKRKLEAFDPNKSDSNDTDFDPTEDRPRKSAKKSQSKKSSGGARKRRKYRGSDVDDDDIDDSLLEDSYSEPEEEEDEDIEMNEKTGRAVRKAAKKSVNYEENSESEDEDIVNDTDSDDDVRTKSSKKSKHKRTRAATEEVEDSSEDDEPPTTRRKHEKLSKVITLKFTPKPARTTRAGSAARTREATSAEPTSVGMARRSTRAHTVEGDEPVELSTSGHHAIRASRSPEPIGRARASRGSKGIKQPASTIKEEAHETSSYEQQGEDTTMANEIAETDVQEPDDDAIEMEHAEPPADADQLAAADEGQARIAIGLNDDEDDDDDVPVIRASRTRGSRAGLPIEEEEVAEVTTDIPEASTGRGRLTRGAKSKSKQRKGGGEVSSDFEPPGEDSEDEISASDAELKKSKAGDRDAEYESSPIRRGRAARQAKSKSNSRRRSARASEEPELDQDELAEELQELQRTRKRPTRRDLDILYETKGRRERKPVDYSIKPMDQIYAADEDAEDAAPTPSRRARGGRSGASQPWERNLYTTFGPFGGGGGPAAVIGGPWGTGAAGGADSDSSDDEAMHRPTNVGGNVGMTPTSAFPPGLLPGLGQTNNAEAIAGLSGTPANLGKIKSQKALADADPLGVDQNVDFSKIGGLEGHIDQLKEMVQMPLLYPELFLKFKVTPPRGVLFHGPPGTGKTLLARALAAQIGSGGRKITFYMRKGADALSKWVGEAERQLRLLFEEARKTQPSIIFFDEIDGLAPVRSSKQEQIHASIVSTLLALMDGMDGRGQVIVIGATNRPDNIDPALRRPGRFDREFYFPLPDLDARKSIINIHTSNWGIDDAFKDSLAQLTKGYGGADLRALCTEAALNSIQRTYPQIYSSNEKLKVDADKIKVTAKDFMLSVKKMIPSSERATSSGASPLPKVIEPLLRDQLKQIENLLDGLIPIKKKTTALQEAMFEQYEDEDHGFGRETLQQDFEKARVFRPRLLIGGESGMGQAYLGGALLNHFEGLHVQNFDLPTIFSDPARVCESSSL